MLERETEDRQLVQPGREGEEQGEARMLEGKARVEDTDMPARMQAAATSAASRALDLFDVADCRAIAGHIKAASPPSPFSLCSWHLMGLLDS